MEYREFLKSAAHVVPSKRQMRWFDTEFYAFVHFTVTRIRTAASGHMDIMPHDHLNRLLQGLLHSG